MEPTFRVHDLRNAGGAVVRDDLLLYLRSLHDRFRNAIHAETRVYTCRAWMHTCGAVSPIELEWNDDEIPGETHLGSFGWSVGGELVERISQELARGQAVRLFTFDSDADLRFEEVLEPTAGPPAPYR